MRAVRRFLKSTAFLILVTTQAASLQAQSPEDASANPKAGHSVQKSIERWLDLQTVLLMARYRRVETSSGVVTANHMQDTVTLRARIKFDPKGRYALNGALQTGPTFTGSWNNVGWGTGGPRTTGLHLKQFFLSAAPAKGLDFSYGGLGFARGESTEITTFDNDAYMAGVRGTVKRPDALYLDEITVTQGYAGDITEPGFFDRLSQLSSANYFQALGRKRFGAAVAGSAEYTHWAGSDTLRAAVLFQTPRARVVDSVRYEQYCRVVRLPACGFAASGAKRFAERFGVIGGYADIDRDSGGTNGDRYSRGRRIFGQFSVRVLRDVSVSAFATHAFHTDFPVSNAPRVDLVVSYNALGPLRRAGFFR